MRTHAVQTKCDRDEAGQLLEPPGASATSACDAPGRRRACEFEVGYDPRMPRVSAATFLLLAACVTTAPFVPSEAELPPEVAALACANASATAGELVGSDAFSRCEYDSDCGEVSPAVSGSCGHFVNAATFETHLVTFERQVDACAQAVQVLPSCPALRAACTDGRCTGEPISSLPDDCEVGTRALFAAAEAENSCARDEDCTLLERGIAGTVTFSNDSRIRQEALAKVCGIRAPVLHGSRQPAGMQTWCAEHRCIAEPEPVNGLAPLVLPELDKECFTRAFSDAFHLPARVGKPSLQIDLRLQVDASARVNQFQFLQPTNLSLAMRAALASRLQLCRAIQPARLRGQPVAMRIPWRFTFIGTD